MYIEFAKMYSNKNLLYIKNFVTVIYFNLKAHCKSVQFLIFSMATCFQASPICSDQFVFLQHAQS